MSEVNPYVAREVFRHIGQAVWHFQAFEQSLAHYLSLIIHLPRKSSPMTVPQLLEQLKIQGRVSQDMIFRIQQLFEDQKWVHHRIVREICPDFSREMFLPPILRRISTMTQEARSLQQEVLALIEDLIAKKKRIPGKGTTKKQQIILSSLEGP